MNETQTQIQANVGTDPVVSALIDLEPWAAIIPAATHASYNASAGVLTIDIQGEITPAQAANFAKEWRKAEDHLAGLAAEIAALISAGALDQALAERMQRNVMG